MHSAVKIYQALIEPHFAYCSSVWDGLSLSLSDKLQKLQNRAVRIITKSSYDTSAGPLLDMLGMDRVSIGRTKQKAILMFKTLNNQAPRYLQDMFSKRQSLYNTRYSENTLQVPKPRTNYLKRSFGYSGAALWNRLPPALREPMTLSKFKKGINDFYKQAGTHTANM